MAKSSKIEDYWRQNNIESLLKELTHTLAQKMPADPALAIVQHLQKKFPKSFKTSIDNNTSMGTVSKTMASSLQLQPISSPRSDTNNDSSNAMDMERRASNVSQVSGIVTIPTAGSAFTDLFKQDTNSVSQAPTLNMRNLVFANRLSQQVVRLGKDIQSDRDILEEELIKPSKAKPNTATATTTDPAAHLVTEDLQHAQTHTEPTTKQLIEYKQKIRLENDRRLHRQKLAELAKKEREKEHILQPDLQTKSGEVQHQEQQQQLNDDQKLPHVAPERSKGTHKPIAKSKEEEDILNDENIFQPRRQRQRDRTRNKTSRSNSPLIRREYVGNLGSTMRRAPQTSTPRTQFGVCKVCGNVMNDEGDQSKSYVQQVSAAPSERSLERKPLAYSVTSSGANVDDWFESASEVSSSREITPWDPDDVTPQPAKPKPFQQTFFQPINENQFVQRRSPKGPLIIADNQTGTKRSSISRMSDSDVFVRTPEPPIRRSSSSLSNPSPIPKKHQPNMLALTDHQPSKTTTHLAPSLTVPITQRRMSGWSVREHSPDDSDEN